MNESQQTDKLKFNSTNKNIQIILRLLRMAEKDFTKKNPVVDTSDNSQDLFSYYKAIFLNVFIELFEEISENESNRITFFSVRTLLEMGVEDSFIIYSDTIPEKERKSYILLILLADYGFTSIHNPQFNLWFDEYFNKNISLLSSLQVSQMTQYAKSLHTNKIDKSYLKRLRDVRRLIFKKKKEIIDRWMYNNEKSVDIDMILSGYSHILHGNPFLLHDLFSQDKKQYSKLTGEYLTIAGKEVVKNINEYLRNPKITAELIKIK